MALNIQKQAAELFAKLDWPTTDDEAWRRTDLRRLLPKKYLDEHSTSSAACPAVIQKDSSGDLLPEYYAARIVLKTGQPVEIALSEQARAAGLQITATPTPILEELARQEMNGNADRITAWHWKCLSTALVICLPAGKQLEAPVVVDETIVCAPQQIAVPHIHIEAGSGSQLNVIWTVETSENQTGNPLVNAGLTAHAAANASLHVSIRQKMPRNTVFFLTGRMQTDRDARVSLLESHTGGQLVKTRVRAVLNGEGSDARLKGMYVVNANQHVDLGTIQEHRKPYAASDALYKGAVQSGGRSIFAGLIEVAPKAAKTDAYLTNRNLLLGLNARADSLPQLNIKTDDVKCSHGSTTGPLNESQIFYLQSRGFSREEAKQELTRAFLSETLSGSGELESSLISGDIDAALEVGRSRAG